MTEIFGVPTQALFGQLLLGLMFRKPFTIHLRRSLSSLKDHSHTAGTMSSGQIIACELPAGSASPRPAAPYAVTRLLVTCLLDPSNPICWPALSRWGGASSVRALRPLLAPLVRAHGSALARLRVPIRWIAPMHAIANQPALARLCLDDARGGGSRVPLGFLASFLFSTPEVAPEAFRRIPVTLVHPTEDHWTPPSMSLAFLQRIAAPTRYVPLEGCGHFRWRSPA
jgi:hypothetical protein